MICNVIGVKEKSFLGRDKETVKGYDVHISHQKKGVEGEAVEVVFFSEKKCNDAGGWVPMPGDQFESERDERGKFQEITVIG